MKISTRSAQLLRIQECFDFLWYVYRKELKSGEFNRIKELRRGFFHGESLTEAQEQYIFSLVDNYKNRSKQL